MAITQYLQNESTFDPDDIKVMSRTPEDSCRALHINGDARARETIAVRIIELARRGEREPAKLRDRVVHEASGAALSTEVPRPRFRTVRAHAFVIPLMVSAPQTQERTLVAAVGFMSATRQ
jgi:hypothetical protein